MKSVKKAKLAESIASEMWFLVKTSMDGDWNWCMETKPDYAQRLLDRAYIAIEKSEYFTSELDLSLKDALVKN